MSVGGFLRCVIGAAIRIFPLRVLIFMPVISNRISLVLFKLRVSPWFENAVLFKLLRSTHWSYLFLLARVLLSISFTGRCLLNLNVSELSVPLNFVTE